MENIDTVVKIVGAVSAPLASAYAILSRLAKKRGHKTVETRNLISSGLQEFAANPEMVTLLAHAKMEEFFFSLTGLRACYADIVRLLAFSADGKVRFDELKSIWSYRAADTAELSFRLDTFGQTSLWVGRILVLVSVLTSIASALLTTFDQKPVERIAFLFISVLMLCLVPLWSFIGKDEETTLRVIRRKGLTSR